MPSSQQEYVRVATAIREQVAAGRWALGTLLPRELDLAAQHGVARATIGRALDILRTEGIIVTEKGVGSRITSIPLVTTVRVGAGDWAIARMPGEAERRVLGMSPGVPVLEVFRDGRGGELHDASVTRIAAGL